jgi:Flp pilus assembly protein TadG
MASRGALIQARVSARPREAARAESVGFPVRRPRRRLGRGQGLVEFAISLPVVLLMVLFGVDFGRVFLGWLTLTNAAREGANFAALNPSAWQGTVNATVQTEYRRLITSESSGINCVLPATLPDPTFPSGDDIGSPAVVSITCQFSLITPLIGGIIGNPLSVSASASFPIRSGTIDGVPVASTIPSGATGGTVAPNPTPSPTPSPTATPIPTPSQLITPVPLCTVPNLVGVRTNQAVKKWTDNGFSANNLIFSPSVPQHYTIARQSLPVTPTVVCTSVMTVYQN